jgi:hypothetical protein
MRVRVFVKATLCSVLLALIIAGAIFLLRAPVLLVTDASLTLLYGVSRAQLKQAEISIKLFRRFIAVPVSENAGPEIIAAAVKSAAKTPKAVLFPYHHAAAAQRYKEEEPGIETIIFSGRNQKTDAPLFIGTDTEADFFKAGIIAAFLAGEDYGTIMVFHNESLGSGDKEAFEKGLLTQGLSKKPLYLEDVSDFSGWESISCVVIAAQGGQFFGQDYNIPVILFSWIDPGMTPEYVKVIFCDSPWSLAYEALQTAENERKALSSELIMPGSRIPGKKALTALLAQSPSP